MLGFLVNRVNKVPHLQKEFLVNYLKGGGRVHFNDLPTVTRVTSVTCFIYRRNRQIIRSSCEPRSSAN